MEKHLKKSLSLLAFAGLVFFLANCQSSKTAKVYSINTDGVMEIQREQMNKDAVRVKGQIMTKAKKIADRYQYEFKVTEVVRIGATFSDAEPQPGQVVLLFTPGVKFDKDAQVIFDAFSTPKRSDERLTLNMIVE
ncbi:MAG: hypothetical protein ACJAVN_002550 [Roseivirga sp.]|jgi:hypothetical protein